jgi:hypothetical protein
MLALPFAVYGVFLLNPWLGVAAAYFGAVYQTGLFRRFQVEYGHHASHATFVRGDRARNRFIHELCTTLALCQNGHEYRKDHLEHHDRQVFTTMEDADAIFLHRFGFRPGRSRRALWWTLAWTVVSPRFHACFGWARIKSTFLTREHWRWGLASVAWLAVLAGAVMVLPLWIALLTIVLPITLFYQASALVQFLTEHAWMVTERAPREPQAYADRCWGRFFGDPLPESRGSVAARLRAWTVWLARLVFLHYPARYAIVVGDMPAHDWHHLCPVLQVSSHTWPTGIYERQKAVDSGDVLGMGTRELWGMDSMLAHIFAILESSPARDRLRHEHREEAPWEAADLVPQPAVAGRRAGKAG